jgi:hypothetical protein
MLPFDSTDPGLINVADQAYPAVPPTQQGLPTPKNFLGSDFAPPPLPSLSLGDPTPALALVANVAGIPAPFSLGTATPAVPSVDVGAQNLVSLPVTEWLISPSGNFQTNNTPSDEASFTISAVVAFDVGLSTERYQIFLGAKTNLFLFGLDLTESLAMFTDNLSQQLPIPAGPPRATGVVNPTRPIVTFDTNSILVYAIDQFGFMLGGTFAAPFSPLSQPTAGQHVQINILRDGPSVLNDTNLPVANVVVAPTPIAAATVVANPLGFQGNIAALDGVVKPFVGSGVPAPPFIGTFEVENQTNLGQGLPANVFQ